MLVQGNITFDVTSEALQFWFNNLVPSLFVEMVLLSVCLDFQVFNSFRFLTCPLQKLLSINLDGLTLLFSCLLLGAPSGAALINHMVKEHRLSQDEARRMISCCCLPTPSFTILTCGTLFLNSTRFSVMIYSIELLPLIFTCMVSTKNPIGNAPSIHPFFYLYEKCNYY